MEPGVSSQFVSGNRLLANLRRLESSATLIPTLEPWQILERRLRVKVMHEVVPDVVRCEQNPADQSEMMVRGQVKNRFDAASIIGLLLVFDQQPVTGKIARKDQGQ